VRLQFQVLERREVLSSQPLPVLMVIADQRDFYYQEYGDTRASLEAAGLDVQVAATTTAPSTPHAGSGQGAASGIVVPDLALADVDADNYSAIAFVGGWGSSMYQYAFPGDYANDHYDGDLTTKTIVNDLIGDFLAQDKYVAAVCHAVTVLAWARVDGVSPLAGKMVSVPWIGGPEVTYEGAHYENFAQMQYDQVVANGATANASSGVYGANSDSEVDDVVVDGRIITAEDNDTAAAFGATLATEVIAAFAADELAPGSIALVGGNLMVQGTAADDTVYIWTSGAGQAFAWLNGQMLGPVALAAGKRVIVHAGEGNDRIYATDSTAPVSIYGEGGHDCITGGHADDVLDGGDGWDRIWAGAGNDFVSGGAGNDVLDGREGNDILLGGAGDDSLCGSAGRDLLIGGAGADRMDGGADDDLLIGGTTSYDTGKAALLSILAAWSQPAPLAERAANLQAGLVDGVFLRWGESVFDDGAPDGFCGGLGADWFLAALSDLYAPTVDDLLTHA
jgi:Ca2+-binding RTX toxin-like protein